jgi:phage terminase large subunit-like protein
VVVRGNTHENMANLPPESLHSIVAKYEGTRLGRQEVEGELLEVLEGK